MLPLYVNEYSSLSVHIIYIPSSNLHYNFIVQINMFCMQCFFDIVHFIRIYFHFNYITLMSSTKSSYQLIKKVAIAFGIAHMWCVNTE